MTHCPQKNFKFQKINSLSGGPQEASLKQCAMGIKKSLLNHRDFVKLWAGESVSLLGTQVTLLALPTIAILLLKATPFQVGLLGALEYLSFPIFGLIAGVYADRLQRRLIMIVSDLGRVLSLGAVPLLYLSGKLTIAHLYVIAAVTGVFTVFFNIAYQSYLPSLIDRTDLIEGNTKLEISSSAAQVAGPSLAGFLIQILGAAITVGIDAASYLISAIAILTIRQKEPHTASEASNFWIEMKEGVHVIFSNPVLRNIVGCTATANIGYNMAGSVFLIFMYRQLSLPPKDVGLILGLSGIGFLFGALMASSVLKRFGIRRTLAVAIFVGGVTVFLRPLALFVAPMLILIFLGMIESMQVPIYNINQVSLRQSLIPDRLQGRMNATVQTIIWGVIPLSQFIGGILGERIGIVQTLLLGGFINIIACIWIASGNFIELKQSNS